MNEILIALRTLLAATFTTTKVFIGKQKIPAQDDLPMISVYPIGERISRSGTLRDNTEFDIGIEVMVNIKTYYDMVNGQGDQLDAQNAIIAMAAARDSDGDLSAGTIMSVVNANLSISGKVLFTDKIEINYDEYMDANKFPVGKQVIKFTAFDRPNRN